MATKYLPQKILVTLISLLSILYSVNADLNIDTLKYYEVISPRLRSLNFSDTLLTTKQILSFKAFCQSFDFILQERTTIPYAHSNFRLLDSFDADKSDKLLSTFAFYDGYLRNSPETTITATISRDGKDIMARIDSYNETYHIEALQNSTIIYRASDVEVDLSQFGERGHSLLVPQCPYEPHSFEQLVRKKRFEYKKLVEKNRCEMKLVADYEFYKVIGNSNYYSAARYLIHVIERVNKIFKAVDWGNNGRGEKLVNLGFLIKEIKIFNHPTPKGHAFHFNNEYSPSGTSQFQVSDLMLSFSQDEGSNASCVTVLVTAKVMEGGILGLAYIGNTEGSSGICANQPHNGFYSNTAVVSVMKKEGLMITRIFDLAFTHEMGHLWGSKHDNEECTNEAGSGRFIMHEAANSGYDKNNYKFSACTIIDVYKVLYNVQHKCFVKEQPALCGNGILEMDEECDGGGRFVAEQMGESAAIEDPCCTSECKLRPNAVCSPKHSECCSSTCNYQPMDIMCNPRSNGTCKAESYCTGNSSMCPVQEKVEDGTRCTEEGTCKNGECVTFCETLNPNYRPCICENVRDSCYRCCKNGSLGKCETVTPYRYLQEGSICILGHCRNNVCEKEVTDLATHVWQIITDIKTTPGSKLLGDYAVFVVALVVLVIWVPFSFFVYRRDMKREKMSPTPNPQIHMQSFKANSEPNLEETYN